MYIDLDPRNWAKALGSWAGGLAKAATSVQNSIRQVMTVKWSYAARRASTAYSELFHTSPRLDAVDIIATDCANAEFKIFRKVDKRKGKTEMEPVYDHPAYALLENPVPGRPDFDGFILRYLTEVYYELHGECFWLLVRDQGGKGQPRECYVVPTTWVISAPSVSQPQYLIMPLGNTSSASILANPEDVIWHKNPDAVQPYGRGRGRTEAIGDQIETSEYADKWQKNFFLNDATPKTVISLPGAGEDNVKAFKAAWNQEFRGVGNANKTAMVGWEAKLLVLGTSPKEMDFSESLKQIANVCREHYQIPPEIFGILENSNRSTVDAARYLYAINVLLKRFKRREAVLTAQFLPMFGSDEFFFQYDNPVQEDREFEQKLYTEGFKLGNVETDEWRTAMGMKPLGGEPGKMRIMPTGFTVIAGAPPIMPVPKVPAAPLAITDNPIPPEPKAKSFRVTRKKLTDDELETLWAHFDEVATQAELPFETSMKEVAKTQREKFKALFDGYVGQGDDPEQAMTKATVEIYGVDAVDQALFKKLAPAWAKAIRDGFDIANDLLGGGVNWKLYNPTLAKWVVSHGLEAAKEINGTTKAELEALRPVIAEGLKNGWSIDDVAKKLNEVYDKLGDSRATLIARTETMMTINHGQFETYSGESVTKKQWLHSAHGDYRETHLAMARLGPIPMDQDFEVEPGVKMKYPGDSRGGVANLANCRCCLAPVIETEE